VVTERRVPCARELRNVSSWARAPNAATASDQSSRASAWGHSSSHASLVVPTRRRRSWETIASCHADSRALSVVASCVPRPELRIVYGFMSHPASLAVRAVTAVDRKNESQRVPAPAFWFRGCDGPAGAGPRAVRISSERANQGRVELAASIRRPAQPRCSEKTVRSARVCDTVATETDAVSG